MLGIHTLWRSGAVVLASALLCVASLASATASVVHDPAGRTQAPAAAAKQRVDAAFGSVSCVPSQSSYPYECEATGWYLNGSLDSALAESSNGTGWHQGEFVPTPPRRAGECELLRCCGLA
jgi:hypothetical protein